MIKKIKSFKVSFWKLEKVCTVFLFSLIVFCPKAASQEAAMAAPLGGGTCMVIGPFMEDYKFQYYGICPSAQGEIGKSYYWKNLLQNPSDPTQAFS
jgi:hypothetical protein